LRHAAARRPVEHPFGKLPGNFKAVGRYLRRLGASKYPQASPGRHLMHEHSKAEPRMPGTKKLPALRSGGRYFVDLYNAVWTHLSLNKDAPIHRPIQRFGRIISAPVLGGLHHQYCQT
jgi:hypothetical protein